MPTLPDTGGPEGCCGGTIIASRSLLISLLFAFELVGRTPGVESSIPENVLCDELFLWMVGMMQLAFVCLVCVRPSINFFQLASPK